MEPLIFAGGKVGADTRVGGEELAGGGGSRVLEQAGREPASGAGGESQLPRFGPPGHPVRGQGDMQGDEQPHLEGDVRRLRRLGRYLVGAPPKRLVLRVPGHPRRANWLHRLRLGWLQEDSQEHERCRYPQGTTHPQDMVRHPEKRDTELRRSRACGNGQDQL